MESADPGCCACCGRSWAYYAGPVWGPLDDPDDPDDPEVGPISAFVCGDCYAANGADRPSSRVPGASADE